MEGWELEVDKTKRVRPSNLVRRLLLDLRREKHINMFRNEIRNQSDLFP